MKRNILLCVAGLTPQIITESLYVLAVEKGVEINEIVVITTKIGQKIVKERLFDSGVWQRFCQDYPQQVGKVRFDMDCLEILTDKNQGEFPDIRTTDENESAANQICKIVKNLTDKKDVTVFASVAGGRKTMGNYLGFAMSLFAKTNDSLSHVLVDEEFERPRKPALNFYYEPPIPCQVVDIEGNPTTTIDGKPLISDMAKTTLAEIPFVRLRRILPEDYGETPKDYRSFVKKVQNELDALENEPNLKIFLREKQLRVGKLKVELSTKQLLIYVLFARQRKIAKSEETAALSYDDLKPVDFVKAVDIITCNESPLSSLIEDVEEGLPDGEFDFLVPYFQLKDGKVLFNPVNFRKIKTFLTQGFTKTNKKLEEANFPPKYFISEKTREGNVPYNWIALEPEKIEFIKTEVSDV